MKKNEFKANCIQMGKQFFFSIPVKRVRAGDFIKNHQYKVIVEDLTDPSLNDIKPDIPNCPNCGVSMIGIISKTDGVISNYWKCDNCGYGEEEAD
jgi:tRNA(Ile2) C34 agmatinyltransferase TiaS